MVLLSVLDNSRLFNVVIDRSWTTLAVALVLFAVCTAGLQRIEVVDVGIRNHFSMHDPHLIGLENFEETYAVSDSLLVVVAPPNDTVFTREALLTIEQLTEQLWQIPYVTRVDSITNHSHSEGQEDELIVEQLVDDAASLTDDAIARIRTIALNTPETAGRFVSHDGRLAGLVVSLALPETSREKTKFEVVDFLYDLAAQNREMHPNFEFHLYGELLLNYTIRDAIDEDMAVLAPIAFATMMLVGILVLRSIWGMLGILAMLLTIMLSAFGFAGWTGMRFYGESAAALFVLMAIAVAHSVHLIQGTTNGMRDGMDRKTAALHSLRLNAQPIFLTSLTTAIGFLSLNFSEMPPFRVMGNIVAFGAMIAFVFSVTLLPALLSIMPIRAPKKRENEVEIFERLGEFVVSNSTALLWIFAIVSIAAAIGITRIELNDNNLRLLDESYELRQTADFINKNFSGLDSFEFSLDSGRNGGITDVEYLEHVEAFANWLREQPEVSHVISITDVMKRLNQNLHADAPGTYVLPDNSDLAAQYLLLYEFSLPIGRDLNNLIDFDRSMTRLTAVIEELSVKEQIQLDERIRKWLQENAPQMATGATGVSIVGAHSVMRNIVNMLIGTVIAMSIVSLLLVFVFKSLRFGLLSLIPNFIPAAMAMGLWGYMVGTVSVAASVVTAIAFGIIVDDTIHIMTKYLRARSDGQSPSEAVIPVFRLVGRPLLTTTVIFALGFLVFGASGLATNQTLGVLVGMTVVIALMADFLLFPPLLVAFDKTKPPKAQMEEQ